MWAFIIFFIFASAYLAHTIVIKNNEIDELENTILSEKQNGKLLITDNNNFITKYVYEIDIPKAKYSVAPDALVMYTKDAGETFYDSKIHVNELIGASGIDLNTGDTYNVVTYKSGQFSNSDELVSLIPTSTDTSKGVLYESSGTKHYGKVNFSVPNVSDAAKLNIDKGIVSPSFRMSAGCYIDKLTTTTISSGTPVEVFVSGTTAFGQVGVYFYLNGNGQIFRQLNTTPSNITLLIEFGIKCNGNNAGLTNIAINYYVDTASSSVIYKHSETASSSRVIFSVSGTSSYARTVFSVGSFNSWGTNPLIMKLSNTSGSSITIDSYHAHILVKEIYI